LTISGVSAPWAASSPPPTDRPIAATIAQASNDLAAREDRASTEKTDAGRDLCRDTGRIEHNIAVNQAHAEAIG
jgi:hypothetical protein